MPNKITNTGIVAKSYDGRGLITHRASTNALVRATNGVLWAAVRESGSNGSIVIYKSTNEGFNWEKMWMTSLEVAASSTTFQAGLNQNGPFMTLELWEERNMLVLWHSYKHLSDSKFFVKGFVFDLDSSEAWDPDNNSNLELDADQFAIKGVYNEGYGFLVYTRFSSLRIYTRRAPSSSEFPDSWENNATIATLSGSFFNIFDAVTNQNSYVNIAIVKDNVSSLSLMHVIYNANGATFSTPVEIHQTNTDNVISDVCIRRDAYNTLVALWSENNGTQIDVKFSTSQDEGVTWTTVQNIDRSLGHGSYIDSPTGQLAARTTMLAGLRGFIFAYTRTNASGIPKTFVRQYTTDNGTTYTLGDEKEVATQTEDPSTPVAGLRFFQPPVNRLLDVTDPGIIRIAYQAGEGNSTIGTDTIPVKFGQELLSESAYPSTIAADQGGLVIDPVSSSQILATVTVMSGPTNNIDYYAAGVTGPITDRYIAAFRKSGNLVRVLRYDPIADAQMNDRSAYSAPTEHMTLAVVTPITYDFPFPSNNESTSTYVERDVRKLHLPPDFYIEREFVLNAGNFLKRTIWTVLFDGNEYELSQVVPSFVNNQLCHYTANAYVVGPSNNPFARPVLPSET